MFLLFLPALRTLLAAAGATAAPAKLHADHPLSYTLWDTRADRPIDQAELFARAIAARWVLVGEKHDHAAHHALQARAVEALGRSGRSYAVVWEVDEPEAYRALEEVGRASGGERRSRYGLISGVAGVLKKQKKNTTRRTK